VVTSLLLAWCRLVLGGVFALSLVGKLRNIRAFRQAIANFRLLPEGLIGLASVLVVGGEFLIVMGSTLGDRWLFPTFLLAALVLVVFSGAMASVLVRQIRTTCQCFGASDKPVGKADLWRNSGVVLCALGGCALLLWSPSEHTHLPMLAWFLTAMLSAAFVALWFRIGDLMALFQMP
jgi:hypothetical protein